MQSTETTTEKRSNFDALIDELHQFARAENAQGMALTANRYVRAALALAAERGRADRAEAALASVWDAGFIRGVEFEARDQIEATNPHRSKATA